MFEKPPRVRPRTCHTPKKGLGFHDATISSFVGGIHPYKHLKNGVEFVRAGCSSGKKNMFVSSHLGFLQKH